MMTRNRAIKAMKEQTTVWFWGGSGLVTEDLEHLIGFGKIHQISWHTIENYDRKTDYSSEHVNIKGKILSSDNETRYDEVELDRLFFSENDAKKELYKKLKRLGYFK